MSRWNLSAVIPFLVWWPLLVLASVWYVGCGPTLGGRRIIEVNAATLDVDTVRIGSMTHELNGFGTLVPVQAFRLSAPGPGKVAVIYAVPGQIYSESAIMMEIKNPDLENRIEEDVRSLESALAEIRSVQAQLRSAEVNSAADLAAIQAKLRDARARNERDALLFSQGLLLNLDYRLSNSLVEDLTKAVGREVEKAEAQREALSEQLTTKQVSAKQAESILKHRRSQLAALRVRLGANGMVMRIIAQLGQQVAEGTDLIELFLPGNLKAALAIPDLQANEVKIGQPSILDIDRMKVPALVSRIDPSFQVNSRTVELIPSDKLPASSAPGKSISGAIEVQKRENVKIVRRPMNIAKGYYDSEVFRIEPGGASALRVRVRFGRSSKGIIEVLDGLQVGDRVIVSDLGPAALSDRIVLKH